MFFMLMHINFCISFIFNFVTLFCFLVLLFDVHEWLTMLDWQKLKPPSKRLPRTLWLVELLLYYVNAICVKL